MSNSLLKIMTVAVAALTVGQASAQVTAAVDTTSAAPYFSSAANPLLIQVADGCGGDRWRGPGGACHWNHGVGWGPYGYYESGPWRVQAGPYWNRSCPSGYWRGPWGHCRDTPYHGALPDGGFKP